MPESRNVAKTTFLAFILSHWVENWTYISNNFLIITTYVHDAVLISEQGKQGLHLSKSKF